MADLEGATLARQSYGIATAGNKFGGPCGIWLECCGCRESQVIVGSNSDEWLAYSDAEVASVFRRYGWTGEGHRLLRARCPRCSDREVIEHG